MSARPVRIRKAIMSWKQSTTNKSVFYCRLTPRSIVANLLWQLRLSKKQKGVEK